MARPVVDTMTPDLTKPLVAVLNEQITCAEAMLGTLTRENRALLDGDTESLNAAGADKARLVAALENLEIERRQLTEAFVSSLVGAPLDAGAGEWQRLLQLVAECKRRNQQNGALLKARSEQVRTVLKALRGAEPQIYGGNGFAAPAGGTRPLGSA
jgi:flagellar biosynthesis/type III secretory pathway chaperone